MKKSKRTKILFAVLASVSLLVTIYSLFAYSVAFYVQEYNGVLVWPTPGYTFLPWPTAPTGIMIAMLEPLNSSDNQYYQYMIHSGMLIVLTIVAWLTVFWIALAFRKQLVF